MNRKNIIALVILIVVILCISYVLIYRNQLLGSFINNKNLNNTSNITNNETSNNIPNAEIDNSEKVAKLYTLLDNKFNNKQYSKDITQNTIDKIGSMIKLNEQIFATFSYINASDYIIEYNDSSNKSIEFRISSNIILAILSSTYTCNIYREDDVKQLLEILDTNMKGNLNYTKIDINKTYSPPKIYINDMYEAVLGSYTWKDEQGNITTFNLEQDPETLLKRKEPVSGFIAPIISTNANKTDNTLTMLPNNVKISYSLYPENLDVNAFKQDAARMINGSYHLYQPNVMREYIYVINMTFTDLPDLIATYYFKYKV